jgi:hypothetical protein
VDADTKTLRVVTLALLVAGVLAWLPGLEGPFILDDRLHIVRNPAIRDATDPWLALRGGYQETRPLFLLTLWLNYAASGLSTFSWHLFNLGLHLGCAVLMHRLALRTVDAAGVDRWVAHLAALVFVVHPMTTEAVTYINSRSGPMAALFGVGAMLVFLRGRRGAAAGLLLLSVLSKESGVVFWPLLLLWLWLFVPEGGRAVAMKRAAPLGLVLLVVPLLFATSTNPHDDTIGFGLAPLIDYWLTQARVLVYFSLMSVFPVHHNLDHDFPVSTGVDGEVAAALLVLSLLVALGWRVRRRAPVVTWSIAWFFVCLAPTNSVVPFVDFVAERHLYASLMGAALLIAWLVWRIPKPAVRWAVAGVCVLGFAVLTARRNAVYADPIALWSQTVAASPQKARPRLNLAVWLFDANRFDDGFEQLKAAWALDPDDPSINYNLGAAYERLRDDARAVHFFQRAVEASPRPRWIASLQRARARLAARPPP